MHQEPEQIQKKNRISARWLVLLVIGMFGFGFAMVPLYSLLCSVTGLNGSTTGRIKLEQALSERVDYNRRITVEFDSTTNADLPWDFYPLTKKVVVHPGEITEVSYFARNNSDKTIIAQAIPGITPWQATEHFNKTECFCFTRQKLEPGEEKVMPLRFIIDSDLPAGFQTITLSYTFMDTDRSNIKKVNELQGVQSSVLIKTPVTEIKTRNNI